VTDMPGSFQPRVFDGTGRRCSMRFAVGGETPVLRAGSDTRCAGVALLPHTSASLTPLREQAERRLHAAQLGMLCGCIRPWVAYASRKISQRAAVVRQNRHREHRNLGMIVVNWAAYSCQLQRSRRLLVCAILGAQLRVERQCLWKWRSVLQDCISHDNATSGRHGTDSLDHSLTEPDELDHSLVSITPPRGRTEVASGLAAIAKAMTDGIFE
jgi:hypothetical protein